MKAQHVAVVDGVGDGVGVQLFFKDVLGGSVGTDRAVDLLVSGVVIKNGCAGKAKELRFWEEFFDGLVVFAELRAVAFVEDKDDALVAQRLEPLAILALVRPVQRES